IMFFPTWDVLYPGLRPQPRLAKDYFKLDQFYSIQRLTAIESDLICQFCEVRQKAVQARTAQSACINRRSTLG
ncbi:MAG: hypothetical protein ACK2UW_01650, partial [Anaerolineales bacterium]